MNEALNRLLDHLEHSEVHARFKDLIDAVRDAIAEKHDLLSDLCYRVYALEKAAKAKATPEVKPTASDFGEPWYFENGRFYGREDFLGDHCDARKLRIIACVNALAGANVEQLSLFLSQCKDYANSHPRDVEIHAVCREWMDRIYGGAK